MNTVALKRAEVPVIGSPELDRQMLMLSVSLWLLHFVFMVSRSLSTGMYSDGGAILARFLTAIAGVVLSFGLYLVLKRGPRLTPLGAFFLAGTLSLPICALLSLIDEIAFSHLSSQDAVSTGLFVDPAKYVFTFAFFYWIFVVWAVLYAALTNAEQLREQERRMSVISTAATAAQLKALQLQFHPHFLFNTLNVLSGLISIGRATDAERVILNLSSFLRHTIDMAPDRLIPLKQELDVVRTYLEIQRIRFGKRLRVGYAIDPDCTESLVPPLMLLPLIENTIKHALAMTEGSVTVTIGAQRNGDVLELWTADEREGKKTETKTSGFGFGLSSTRERLSVMFGHRASMSASSTHLGWMTRLAIPWMKAG